MSADAEKLSVTEPVVIAEHGACKKYQQEIRTQMMFGTWGGQYKKKEACKSEGRVQQPTSAGKGKEETDAYFGHVSDLFQPKGFVDTKKLPSHVGALLNTTWLFGYDNKMYCTANTPNGLSMAKFLTHGSVNWVLFNLSDLVSALKIIDGSDQAYPLDALMARVEKFEVSDLCALAGKGCVAQRRLQVAGECLYIPAGWIAAEIAAEGVLLYGVRKTWVPISQDCHNSYEELIGCYTAEQRPVANMNEVAKHMLLEESL